MLAASHTISGGLIMRTSRLIAVPLVAVSAIALAGCMPFIPGPMTSEDREIDSVTTVVLDTSGDITITEGEPSLVIHASQGALDRLTSDVNGDTLVLGTKPGPGFTLGEVRYELTLPDLEAIELNGSGDIDATVSAEDSVRLDLEGSGDVNWTGLAANRVEIRLAGSGDIELAGATGDLTIELDGSGNIDAAELEAQDVTVAIDGSGDVDVFAQDTLSAEVAGSGRVTYSGDPSVSADVTGSGTVVHE
jgi:hypothetical protein